MTLVINEHGGRLVDVTMEQCSMELHKKQYRVVFESLFCQIKEEAMSVRHAVLGMLFLAALPSLSHASCAAPTDLNGVWKADDGGLYYVRQAGNDIWWVGMSADEGRTWTNVFRGTKNGTTVVGEWADVPRGGANANGMLKLAVQEGNGAVAGFTRTEVTGGFGGAAWHLNCPGPALVPVNE